MKDIPWVACIAKENYDYICKVYKDSERNRNGRKLVIFGAGIMGLQLRYTLQELGENNFVFCDNDSRKWGKKIAGIDVIPAEELRNHEEEYFVFLAMERYEECANQLCQLGYQEKISWEKIENCSEKKFIEAFRKDEDAQILVLGDCAVATVSIFEEDKESLAELLYQKNHVKVMALNSLYMRAYYNLLLLNMERMKSLKEVVLLLDLSIFHEKYALLPGSQHSAVFEKLANATWSKNDEVNKFLNASKNREKSEGLFMNNSPNRIDNISGEKLEQERMLHMKLNNLYRIVEDTESIKYLDMFIEMCVSENISITCFLLPVNYELGEKYFGNLFFETYGLICNTIIQHIEKAGGKVVDGSYKLKSGEFLSLRSANEGLTAIGRRKIFNFIYEQIIRKGNEYGK